MGASSAIRAGRAFVELLVNDAGLKKGLDKAGKQLQKWGAAMTATGTKLMAAGAAILAPLAASSKVFATMGDQLAKASTRTGVAVEALSALAYAAEQSGTDLEGLEGGLRKMAKFVVEAAKGGDQATDTLRQLGLSVDDLRGLKPDEQFVTLAQAISEVKDPTLKAALAMEVFGKTGTSLLPLMADGAEGINELVKRAHELGLVWSTEDAKAAEEFGDRMDDAFKVLKHATAMVGAAVMPIFRQLAVAVTTNGVAAIQWVNAHRPLIQTALKVGLAVAGAGAAFVAVGATLATAGVYTRAISVAFGAVSNVVSGLATVLRVALFSGVGLLLSGVVALGAYFLYASGAGAKMATALAGYFTALGDIAGQTFQGIFDAITAGRWDLAVQVAMKGVKAEWLTGILPLREGWAEFTGWFGTRANNLMHGALAGWEIATGNIADAWYEMTSILQTAWTMAVSKVKQVWDGVQGYLTEKWLKLANLIGMISDADFEKAVAENNKQSQANVSGAIEQELADIKRGADAIRKYRADSQKERNARLEAIATENQRLNGQEGDAARKAAEQARRDAVAAQFDLGDKTDSAGKYARAAGSEAPTFKPPSADDFQAGLDALLSKTTARGTFNSAAFQSLQGGGVDRIARATEATAKNTEKMAKQKPAQAVFG